MHDHTYERARERIEWFSGRDRARYVGEQGRTLVFDHGARTRQATLLLHGLSAGPLQFVRVAEELHARGHNVFVPRLPRHGYGDRLSGALAGLNARQLEACANDSLSIARGLGEHVNVAGFSLGGLLAAHLGQFEPVHRVVAVSPFLGLGSIPSLMGAPIGGWLLRLPNRFLWWDPFLRERQLPAHGYPRFATHAIGHALAVAQRLMQASAASAPAGDEFVLIINASDSAVNTRAIARLGKNWARFKPSAVRVQRLSGLPRFAHDIIEPKRYPAASERVTRLLVELLDA